MNKKVKSINGNGNNKQNTIEIINWNKGAAHISKKIDDIKYILEKHKPKIMVINELNFNEEDDEDLMKVEKYSFEYDNLRKNNKTARTGMFIRNDMAYTRAKYLENDKTSCVAVRIGFPKRKKFTVIGYYRQWNQLYTKNNKDRDIFKEAMIVKEITSKWINQIKKEVITIGDFNVHNKSILCNENKKSTYEKSLNKISNI